MCCETCECKIGAERSCNPFDGRYNNCPLVSVPPHGRLIEANHITDQILSGCDDYTGFEIRRMVEDAPTIIPAEEGET